MTRSRYLRTELRTTQAGKRVNEQVMNELKMIEM